MEDAERQEPEDLTPANDNQRPGSEGSEDTDIAPWQRVDRVVLSIARLIGRRIAREHFAAPHTANDNAGSTGEAEGRE
ncbi:hypothetical protein SAZ10_10645 [Mesorhizobium sp. BAC0120]|uniref:hypothetical protein n=1 Tax=Mesorhizobium sp. BAC0120 TaxID=3090670 RepID=UPI00298CF90F|nr:hypothetical protein [Mesorhizobium sp. BAC0120]MDW6022211.1 hypothetical protein [Mesorhizobium sp. BAC0120]